MKRPAPTTGRAVGVFRRRRSDQIIEELIMSYSRRPSMTLGTILLIVLILMLIGALPTWGYSSSWGYGPSGGLGLVLLVVVALLVMGRI
jgi:hypothetical protein